MRTGPSGQVAYKILEYVMVWYGMVTGDRTVTVPLPLHEWYTRKYSITTNGKHKFQMMCAFQSMKQSFCILIKVLIFVYTI